MAEIVKVDEGTRGEYSLAVDGSDQPAVLTWHARGNSRVAAHTFTPPAARGKGMAARLVEALMEDARAEGFTVVPQCSYVAVLFKRHPEWADLRA